MRGKYRYGKILYRYPCIRNTGIPVRKKWYTQAKVLTVRGTAPAAEHRGFALRCVGWAKRIWPDSLTRFKKLQNPCVGVFSAFFSSECFSFLKNENEKRFENLQRHGHRREVRRAGSPLTVYRLTRGFAFIERASRSLTQRERPIRNAAIRAVPQLRYPLNIGCSVACASFKVPSRMRLS